MAYKKTSTNTTAKKETTTRKTSNKAKTGTPASAEAPVKEEPKVVEEIKVELPPLTKDTQVQVASAVHGELIWRSSRTGYKVIWGEFGDRNTLSIEDLFDMRNGSRSFFTNNWITIEDPRADEILKMLNLESMYTVIHHVEDIDDIILNNTPEAIEESVIRMPYSVKEEIAQRAYELEKSGKLDSSRIIKAIENATNIHFED